MSELLFKKALFLIPLNHTSEKLILKSCKIKTKKIKFNRLKLYVKNVMQKRKVKKIKN